MFSLVDIDMDERIQYVGYPATDILKISSYQSSTVRFKILQLYRQCYLVTADINLTLDSGFIQVWMMGGGVPHSRAGWWGWGVPNSRSGWWGVPHPRSGWWGYPGYPLARSGWCRVPHTTMTGWGTPGQVWMVWGTQGTMYHDWMGTPTMTGWGSLHHDWMRYPPPWLDGVPPSI